MSSSSLSLSLFNPEDLSRDRKRDGRSQTLTDFFATFELVKLSKAKAGTVQKYRDSLAHWRSSVGSVPLDEITTSEILAFYRHLLSVPGRHGAERLADHSIYYHLIRIRAILKLAHHRHLLRELPDFPEHAIDPEAKLQKYWASPEDIERVLLICDRKRRPRVWRTDPGDWWRAAIYVTYWTACRIGETLTLRQSDLDGDVLTIRPTLKRAKDARVVVLDARSLAYLALLRHGEDRIFHGLAPQANLARHFQRLFAWAGITLPPGNAWHTLRRGRCESEFQAGGAAYAQARLGHRDLATTEASYLREQIRREQSIAQQRALLAQHNATAGT